MIEPYATLPEQHLSLAIRMDQQRRRTKIASFLMAAGTALLAGGAYNFTRPGYVLIASWLTVIGLGLVVAGVSRLKKRG